MDMEFMECAVKIKIEPMDLPPADENGDLTLETSYCFADLEGTNISNPENSTNNDDGLDSFREMEKRRSKTNTNEENARRKTRNSSRNQSLPNENSLRVNQNQEMASSKENSCRRPNSKRDSLARSLPKKKNPTKQNSGDKSLNQKIGSTIGKSVRNQNKSSPIKRNKSLEKQKNSNSSPTLICKVCSTKFTLKNNLVRHLERTHGIKNGVVVSATTTNQLLKCNFCPQTDFSSPQTLQVHTRQLHPEKLFHCSDCFKSFPTENALVKHSKKIHDDNQEQAKCEICFKVFHNERHLIKHVMIHNTDKPFKCDKCPKSFVEKRQFQQHLSNQHGGEKPFKCSICSAAFLYEAVLLREHMPLHSDIRPFPCDICGKSYKTKKTMLRHKKHFCSTKKFTDEASSANNKTKKSNGFSRKTKVEGVGNRKKLLDQKNPKNFQLEPEPLEIKEEPKEPDNNQEIHYRDGAFFSKFV